MILVSPTRLPVVLRGVLLAAALAVGVKVAAQASLAAAIVLSPNASGWSEPASMAVPPELSSRGARSFRVPLRRGGGSLASWVVEPAAPAVKGTAVLLHGVRADKRSLTPLALALCDAGYRAVLVDLPGHGESAGRYLSYGAHEPAEISGLLDALAGSGVQLGPVGAYGFSYGAAVALDLAAADRRVKTVVAVSSFASLREVVVDYRRKYLPSFLRFVPDDWFLQAVSDAEWFVGFDAEASAPLRSVSAGRAATLLIHGDADTQVPLRHGQRLERASRGRARLHVVPGATHDVMPADATHVVRDRVVRWFDSQMS